ncbi:MAG: nucleotidyltransferase domain-containing protein [Methanobacteriaceae archaeon]|jgi:predicted nucleotidyltransferase
MIEEEFKLPLMDLIEKAGEIPNLIAIILFGSAVTGGVSKKSDIDLLLVFDTDHNPEIGRESEIAHKIATEISIKHDLRHSFSLIFVNKKHMEEIEPDFLWNVAKEGILIWSRPVDILMGENHPSLEPMILIKYSTKNLKENEKRKLLRSLYSSQKKLINKEKERLGQGIILTTAEKFDKLKELLDSFNANYSVKKIWTH